jgi:hypothetical protein
MAELNARAHVIGGRAVSRTLAGLATSAVPILVTLISAVYVGTRIDRGWWPHDEGTLAEPAARILRGELPHRDFVDAYTGALSYVHAAAFALFGRDLTSLRLVLFMAFVLWVPALYYVASRFGQPLDAGLVCLTAVAWSVPNYTASMPSWYCTFLATFGIAALLRQLETGNRRWLLVAGLCGGISITIKIVGIYYVAGVLAYLAFKAASDAGMDRREARRGLGLGTALAVALAGGVTVILRHRLGAREVVNFELPVLALAVFVWWVAGRAPLRSLAILSGRFLAGVTVPVAVFVAPYVATGAVGDLLHGVWPLRRLDYAAVVPPTPWTLVALFPVGFGLAMSHDRARFSVAEKRAAVVAAALLAAAALVASKRNIPYDLTWQSLRALVPVLIIGGLVCVVRRASSAADAQPVVLLLAVCAMCSLVQFPFAAPIYFAYVAPLVIVTAVAVGRYCGLLPRPLLWVLLAFYLAFGVTRLNTGTLATLGIAYVPRHDTYALHIEGANLDVTRADQQTYDRMVSLVHQHARSTRFVYATPDCPEVYFLTGLRNPTKTLFEFLDDPQPTAGELLRTLNDHGVGVVVINTHPAFSGSLVSARIIRAFALHYPHFAIAGRFVVRWRT